MNHRPALLRPSRGILRSSLIGALAFSCGVALTATSGWLILEASTQPVILSLFVAIVGVRAFGIGRPTFRYVERLLSHNAALRDLTQRRTATYAALIPLTPVRLGRRKRADLLTGVVRDVDDEVDAQVRVIVPLITVVVTSIIAVAVASSIAPVAGIVVAVVAIVSAVIGVIDARFERTGQEASIAARAESSRIAHLISAHTSEIQAINAQTEMQKWLQRAQTQETLAAKTQARGRAIGIALSLVLTGISTVAMGYVLAEPLSQGEFGRSVAAMLVLLPLALGDVTALVPDAVGSWARSHFAQKRLQKLLAQKPAIADAGTKVYAPKQDRPPTLVLDNVTASWTGNRVDTGPISHSIPPGSHIAITGSNGSGKSTLLAVLARHLDPISGQYLVDGVDATQFTAESLRSAIAFVDDDPHIFAGTVRANLLLARPHASDADCVAALQAAGLGAWLQSLPNGLETTLGESMCPPASLPTGETAHERADGTPDNPGGTRSGVFTAGHDRSLSGGERARLGIARAHLSGRPVILLDEPVAHVDAPTAKAVLADVVSANEGRTVILVTHQGAGLEHFPQKIRLQT